MRQHLSLALLLLSSIALGPSFVDARPALLGTEDGGMSTDSSNESEEYGPIEYDDHFQYAGIEVGN